MRRRRHVVKILTEHRKNTVFERRYRRRRDRHDAKHFLFVERFDALPPRSVRWGGPPEGLHAYGARQGTLQRWLKANVGRSWDRIWSDVCRNTPGRAYFDPIRRERVKHEVSLHFELRRGLVCACGSESAAPLRTGDLFVCPTSGILRSWPEGG